MIFLYPEQLQKKITINFYNYCYILFGNNEFLLHDTKNFIFKNIQSLSPYECLNFSIDSTLTKEHITHTCQTDNLFTYKRKIFLLTTVKEKSNFYILKKLPMFANFLYEDSLLILHIHKLSSTLKKFFYSQEYIKKTILFIDCNTPKLTRLTSWISSRAQNLQINLDKVSYDLLCSYYENDLNGLNQLLNQLSIMYPHSDLSLHNIKKLISDTSSHFHLSDLLDTILDGNSNKCNHILKQLKTENTSKPITILHTIQHTVSLLIILKRKLLHDKNFSTVLLSKYKIPKYRHILFIKALKRLNIQKLYQTITLLLQIELTIHQEYRDNIWKNFNLVVWLLCNDITNHINDDITN